MKVRHSKLIGEPPETEHEYYDFPFDQHNIEKIRNFQV
jgi:hypothetical protein